MVPLDPAARLEPPAYANANEEAFAPVTLMPVIASVALPVFVKVMDWEALDVPTFWRPNARLGADSDTCGITPVPLNAMVWGEPGELSMITMAAVSGPVAVGAKWP